VRGSGKLSYKPDRPPFYLLSGYFISVQRQHGALSWGEIPSDGPARPAFLEGCSKRAQSGGAAARAAYNTAMNTFGALQKQLIQSAMGGPSLEAFFPLLQTDRPFLRPEF
jgi:hypothetical protein